jgi:hypothetical protein
MLNEEVHESDRATWSAMMLAANAARSDDAKSMDVYCVEQNSGQPSVKSAIDEL